MIYPFCVRHRSLPQVQLLPGFLKATYHVASRAGSKGQRKRRRALTYGAADARRRTQSEPTERNSQKLSLAADKSSTQTRRSVSSVRYADFEHTTFTSHEHILLQFRLAVSLSLCIVHLYLRSILASALPKRRAHSSKGLR